MKTKKRILSVLLAAVMLLLIAHTALVPIAVLAADDAFVGEDYYLKLLYPDIQAFQGSKLLAWKGSGNTAYYSNYTDVYLARNEKEGYQIYFYEEGDGRDLRLEVSPYVNANGDELPFEICNERFFKVANVIDRYTAEALVPYAGETVSTENEKCVVFYVELRAAKDQTPGTYTGRFTLYDGNDNVVRSEEVTATVWNFALPEAHYSTMIGGLYNSNSGYGDTKGFLEASGIRFSGNTPVEEDLAEAERILEGWQEFLLDHGVSTYEIPRWLMSTDEKAAALTIADPRRKAVAVPLYRSGANVTAAGQAVISQYYGLTCDNGYLLDKMFFYPADEPGWTTDEAAAATTALVNNIRSLWPDAHTVIPINNVNAYGYQGPKIRELTDIFCPNQVMLNGHQEVYDDFTGGGWHRTWRYLCNDHTGCIAVIRWGKTPMGTYIRAPFWQAEAMGSDGLLNWNVGYVPYQNGQPYDIWSTETVYPRMGTAGVNGEAILVYESRSLGFDPATPIASLRLKHVSNAQDDYDYLELAKEAFGTGADSPYTRAMNKVFQYYTSKGPKYIFSSETSAWSDGGNYEWFGHEDKRFMEARQLLGDALSEAWQNESFDHTYTAWEPVVAPDETHNGLAVRTCAKCGTVESRETHLCDDGAHAFSVHTGYDDTYHVVKCAYCGLTQLEEHDQTIYGGREATCYTDGETEGMMCEQCGYEFYAPEVIPAHHTLTYLPRQEPTCAFDGYEACWQCTRCGAFFADENGEAPIESETPVPIPGGHTLVCLPGKEPSCYEDGYTACWKCSRCGAFFADENGTVELQAETHEPIPRSHTLKYLPQQEPTCAEDGYEACWQCTRCGEFFADANGEYPMYSETPVLIPGGHIPQPVSYKAPTCTENGNIACWQCARCGANFADEAAEREIYENEVILPARHTLTHTGAKAATCKEPGNAEYWKCSVCGLMFTDENGRNRISDPATPKTNNHSWNGGETTKAPTCTENGEMTFTCTVCGETKKETLNKLGHTAPNGEGKCERCGAILADACKYCGQAHTGFFGRLVGFFHSIAYFFTHLFRR